jgi:hypothetical protein
MASSTSNFTGASPSLTLPGPKQLTANGTVSVSGVSYTDVFAQNNPGLLHLTISAGIGDLYGYYPAATGGSSADPAGTGSNTITFQGSYAAVQDIINSVTYVAAGSGGPDDIHYDIWNQAGTETIGDVTVSGGGDTDHATIAASPPSHDPTLTEPASETVAAGATQAVSGSYSDSFAAGNPGALYLGISDSSGTLRATDASGHVVTGSGSDSISLNVGYADLNAVLASLAYAAGPGAGSDTIHFDIWNQAGVETTDAVPVAIISGGGGSTETWTGAVSNDWNTAGNWSGDAVPTSGDTVIVPGNTPHNATLSNATLTGEIITLDGSGSSSPLVVFNDVTLDSLLQADNAGMVQIGGTLTIGAHGTLETDANATLTLSGTAEAIVNNGLIRSAAGGYLLIYNGPSTITTAANMINNGSIVTGGGTINFASPVAFPGSHPVWMFVNAGSVDIADGGDLVLNGTFQGGDVAFTGTVGALTVERTMAFTDGATVSGFGPGDRINLEEPAAGQGGQLGFANGTLDVTQHATLVQTIPLLGSGSFTLGNFEDQTTGGPGNASVIVYAASGQPSGQVNPEVVTPAAEAVAQGATLALNGVSIENFGTGSVAIDVGSGTLYMHGASGSGTNHLTLGPMTEAQANADLASLTYVPAVAATTDTVTISTEPPAPVFTTRSIPISITGGGPTLSEPASDTVASGGTVAVGGSYSDSFAAGNPGSLFLGISDGAGTLSATNASGQTVAGSGSNSIAFSTDYVDANAILASLHYTAGGSAGSDTIRFDVWNQAGTESTASTAVTIDPPAFDAAATTASSDMIADFSTVSAGSVGATMPLNANESWSGSLVLDTIVSHPIGIMPTEGG